MWIRILLRGPGQPVPSGRRREEQEREGRRRRRRHHSVGCAEFSPPGPVSRWCRVHEWLFGFRKAAASEIKRRDKAGTLCFGELQNGRVLQSTMVSREQARRRTRRRKRRRDRVALAARITAGFAALPLRCFAASALGRFAALRSPQKR